MSAGRSAVLGRAVPLGRRTEPVLVGLAGPALLARGERLGVRRGVVVDAGERFVHLRVTPPAERDRHLVGGVGAGARASVVPVSGPPVRKVVLFEEGARVRLVGHANLFEAAPDALAAVGGRAVVRAVAELTVVGGGDAGVVVGAPGGRERGVVAGPVEGESTPAVAREVVARPARLVGAGPPNALAKTKKSGKSTEPLLFKSAAATKPASPVDVPKALAKTRKSGKSTVPFPFKSGVGPPVEPPVLPSEPSSVPPILNRSTTGTNGQLGLPRGRTVLPRGQRHTCFARVTSSHSEGHFTQSARSGL